MFRKRPSKGHKKHDVEAKSLQQKPSRIIRLHYFETPEVEEQSSIYERASISTAQSIYEEQTLPEEPLFHEPFLYTEEPTLELESYEEEPEEEEDYKVVEDYPHINVVAAEEEPEEPEEEEEEEIEEEETEQDTESLVPDQEGETDSSEEDEEDYDDETVQIYQAYAVPQPRAIFKQGWGFPVIKINDMFEHYLDSEDSISVYSIHEPAVATVVPILSFSKPRLVDIPSVAGRKRKTQYDTLRQHSRNNSNSSDDSSQYSSNEGSSHSDNESNGAWESPASSVSHTPTATSPPSPLGPFPPKRARTRTNPYTRPMSGTFPQLDKLAAERHKTGDDMASNKPFRRSVTRSVAPERTTSLVLPSYAEHDDIDEMLEKADRAMRRREWQSSSSVWHR